MPDTNTVSKSSPTTSESGIKDVWSYNLKKEFETIRSVIQVYNFVAIDTEFPGTVTYPVGDDVSPLTYQYQMIRSNVNLLNMIQLGLTFFDKDGRTPDDESPYNTWQFNFKFDLKKERYSQDSINLLRKSGIQFSKHETDGIDPLEFAELIITSGVVLINEVTFICFHSCYDISYMLKVISNEQLPETEEEFMELVGLYFPNLYDLKVLMSAKYLRGGLQDLAQRFNLKRLGTQHQAGSDSLITGLAFFQLKELFFDNYIDPQYGGHIYGIGPKYPVYLAPLEIASLNI